MTDSFVVRAVVLGLILFGALTIVGAMWLTAMKLSVPDPLWTIAGGAVGALGTLLARTSTDRPVVTAEKADVKVSAPAASPAS